MEMEKQKKLLRALELCAMPVDYNSASATSAGSGCCLACPYNGETRGGKTCRAWLLTDALLLILDKQSENEAMAEKCEHVEQERDALRRMIELRKGSTADVAEAVVQAIQNAEYWRGQSDALKWCLHDRFADCAVEEAGDDV